MVRFAVIVVVIAVCVLFEISSPFARSSSLWKNFPLPKEL